ncbi:MAG: CobW family GTP-binding protein, partial [Gammaproteobacteria bacterium]
HLLRQVPEGERWAVLVNEFGQVGVDGGLLRGDENGVFVEEVAGGCLCCVGSAGMQVGLNRLIRESKPHRILIEPTGLGHPAQLIEQLTGPLYRDVIDLRATIGLLDARALQDKRYTTHPNFQDQIHLADVLIGNKLDLYAEHDREAFYDLIERQSPPKRAAALVESGRIDPDLLDLERMERQALFPEAHAYQAEHGHHDHDHEGHAHEQHNDVPPNPRDWHRVEGTADGFYSCGWRLGEANTLDPACLRQLMRMTGLIRMKGFVQHDSRWLAINATAGEWSVSELEDGGTETARLEVISADPMDWAAVERQLRQCGKTV